MKRAERSVDIEAPPRACFDALVDFASYPDWQSAVRDVQILDDGDPVRVSFEVDAKVKKVRYVLDYHLEGPEHLSWDYVEGDVKAIEGEYRLEPLDGGGTRATYVLGIDPGRVNVFERWESQAAVEAFRGSGPSDEQGAAILSGSVAEYEIVDERPLFDT